MAFGDVLEVLFLGHTLCGSNINSVVIPGAAVTLPLTSTRYVGLITSITNTGETRATATEVGTTSAGAAACAYARQALSAVTSPTSPGGLCQNSAVITFPEAAGADWGTVQYVGIYDTIGAAVGNLLYYATLSTARNVSIGDTVQIAAGALTIQLL